MASRDRVQTRYPWEAVLETAGEGEVVATARDGPARRVTGRRCPTTSTPRCSRRSRRAGIEALWSHQADALESARRGSHDRHDRAPPAASRSPSTCPCSTRSPRDPRGARALPLPDQGARPGPGAQAAPSSARRFLRHAIYDGDTPREERRAIRQRSNLILTNPDMLHVGVLPNHRTWGDVLANLAWVVVDEAHVYRGVFGSHVANVLRRLRRLARAYGAEPRFVLTSATIANPRRARPRGSPGLEMQLVDRDGAPHAEREVAMWNPPLVDEKLGTRASALSEAAELLAELVAARRAHDLLPEVAPRRRADPAFTRLRLEDAGRADLAERIAPYRAGYTPTQRREIERRLAAGELLAVVATNALELGIDVGDLDAAICVTFPGTVASLRQMWGRAGRRDAGLAMYVAGEDALDQFFCRHPDEFLDRPVERGDPRPRVRGDPPRPPDGRRLRAAADARGRRTCSARAGSVRASGWCSWASCASAAGATCRAARASRPAEIALRSRLARLGGDRRGGRRRDDRQRRGGARAFGRPPRRHLPAHGPALRGRGPRPGQRRALVAAASRATGTRSRRRRSDTWIEQVRERRECCGVELSFGIVSVTEQVVAYQKKRVADHAVARPAAARHARAELRDPGALVRAARRAAARGVPARRAPGLAARGRARRRSRCCR